MRVAESDLFQTLLDLRQLLGILIPCHIYETDH
jgi:hypothetical protein